MGELREKRGHAMGEEEKGRLKGARRSVVAAEKERQPIFQLEKMLDRVANEGRGPKRGVVRGEEKSCGGHVNLGIRGWQV